MSPAEELNTAVFPNWCPGCGDFGIWAALKNAIVQLKLPLDKTLIVYGIGCHGHMVNFLNVHGFEGLHGRPLPVAIGAKIANHELKVIVIAGDGDTLGEGVGHLISACRGNHDITCLIHDNQVYGLTTGQASPTASRGHKSKSTPEGTLDEALDPIALTLSVGASFIARGFAGDISHLTEMVKAAIGHKGFAFLDVYQPCVTFNKVNTYDWFRQRIYKLEETYKPDDKKAAFARALERDRLPLGIFYREKRSTFEDGLPQIAKTPLVTQPVKTPDLTGLLQELT